MQIKHVSTSLLAVAVVAVCLSLESLADLPAGFLPLEYIEGTGTQCIDTGYNPRHTTRTVLDFQLTAVKGQYWLFGSEKATTAGHLVYAFYVNGTAATSGKFAYARQNDTGNWTSLNVNADTKRHVFDFNFLDASNKRKVTVSGTTINYAITQSASTTAEYSMCLGARHDGGVPADISKHRIYSCQIYEGNEIVLDFVPAIRASDAVAGLYEMTNGVFHASAGNDAYVASPDVEAYRLDISAVPVEYGCPTPGYEAETLLAAAETLPVSCPPAWTNQDATLRAVCTGWKLYDAEGTLLDSGAENAFTYVHPSPAAYRRLEWQWRTERLRYIVHIGDVPPCYPNISIAFSCADPSDDQGGGYFSPGAQLTLSITDPDGRFSDWFGAPDGVDATANTISWTVDSDYTISPRLDGWVFPDRAAAVSSWYVDFATGSNENDGRSWAMSLADFSNVLARARADYNSTQRKQYVFVPEKPGVTQTVPRTYTIATGTQTICLFTLDFPCVIQGAGRRENVRLGLSNYPYPTGSVSYKAGLFKIAHADAAMRNLTLTGYQRGKYQYPLRVTAGMLDNCVFGPNLIGSYDEMLSPLVVEGGVVTNCLVTGNDCYTMSSRYMYSSGIYISGNGVVTHTIVHGNVCSGGAYGGGVYMVGGTLRNSLVYNNEAVRNASGVYTVPTANCLIENCTIADNKTKAGTSYAVYGLGATGSAAAKKTTVRNTVVYGNTDVNGVAANLYRSSATYVELYNNLATESFDDSATTAGNVVGDPRFTDAAARDYTTSFSAAVDAGQTQDWMATGTDLAFGPRIRGGAVDIGAYEYVPSAVLDASCTIATLFPASGAATRLSATATGGTAPYSYRWLVDGTVIAEGADKAICDYVFPGGHHTVSLVVTDAASDSVVREAPGVVTVYVPETYVATDGSNTDPYDTPAKAARSLNDAFNLTAANGTVHVLPGDYALAAQLNYSRPNVTVRSTEGPARTTINVARGVSAVKFSASVAVLDGVTLQGFNSTAITYFSNGGLVTNCVIRGGSGMAVNFGASGTLADCLVEGVTNSAQVLYERTDQGGSGAATIKNCRFLDNCSTDNYAFHFFRNGVTVRNCLFARNRASKSQLIRIHSTQMGNGITVFESCTFADNMATGWASIEKNEYNYRITFRNNVWAGNKTTGGAVMAIGSGGYLIANNCVVDGDNHTTGTWTDVTVRDDPGLRRDYVPKAGSPCVNHGLYQTWMDTALDLAGNPRILHKTVDIGAFERRQAGTILSLR